MKVSGGLGAAAILIGVLVQGGAQGETQSWSTWLVDRPAVAPIIDGEVQAGEYPGQALVMDRTNMLANDGVGTPDEVWTRGEPEAHCWWAWDDTYLYIGAHVLDDVVLPLNESEGSRGKGDCFFMSFVSRPVADGYEIPEGVGIRHAVWPSQADDPHSPHYSVSDADGDQTNQFPGSLVASHLTDDGYEIELAIRWDEFHAETTEAFAGLRLGFALCVVDADPSDVPTPETATWWTSWDHETPNDILLVDSSLPHPAAADDEIAVPGIPSAQQLDVLGNDDIPANTGVAWFTQPVGGHVSLAEDGTLQLTPDTGFSGEMQFSYALEDAAPGWHVLWRKLDGLDQTSKSASSVGIHGDTLVVGVPQEKEPDSQVYVFEREPGQMGDWSLHQVLAGTEWLDGYALAICGDTLVVGTPTRRILVYKRDASGYWVHQEAIATDLDAFGTSSKLSLWEDTLAAGTFGQVVTYVRDPAAESGGWRLQGSIATEDWLDLHGMWHSLGRSHLAVARVKQEPAVDLYQRDDTAEEGWTLAQSVPFYNADSAAVALSYGRLAWNYRRAGVYGSSVAVAPVPGLESETSATVLPEPTEDWMSLLVAGMHGDTLATWYAQPPNDDQLTFHLFSQTSTQDWVPLDVIEVRRRSTYANSLHNAVGIWGDTVVLSAGGLRVGEIVRPNVASVTVEVVPVAPEFTSTPPVEATETVPYTYAVTTVDPGAQGGVVLTAQALPGWLSLDSDGDGTGTLTGTPTCDDVGTHTVTLRATAQSGAWSEQDFAVDVAILGALPVFTSSPEDEATEDQTYTWEITVHDDDGDALTLSPVTLPDWLRFVPGNGASAALTGTPDDEDVGVHTVAVAVEDGIHRVEHAYTLTVLGVNDPPSVVGQQEIEVAAGDTIALTVADLEVEDPDSDPEGLSLIVLPGDHYTTDGSMVTPDEDFRGTLTVNVELTDDTGAASDSTVLVEVTGPASSPLGCAGGTTCPGDSGGMILLLLACLSLAVFRDRRQRS